MVCFSTSEYIFDPEESDFKLKAKMMKSLYDDRCGISIGTKDITQDKLHKLLDTLQCPISIKTRCSNDHIFYLCMASNTSGSDQPVNEEIKAKILSRIDFYSSGHEMCMSPAEHDVTYEEIVNTIKGTPEFLKCAFIPSLKTAYCSTNGMTIVKITTKSVSSFDNLVFDLDDGFCGRGDAIIKKKFNQSFEKWKENNCEGYVLSYLQ